VTHRKNYNSIVFITTLGVYFGLVLVCGAPQITAQTAKFISGSSSRNHRQDKPDLDGDGSLGKFLEGLKANTAGSLNVSSPAESDIAGGRCIYSGVFETGSRSHEPAFSRDLTRTPAYTGVSHGQIAAAFHISLNADSSGAAFPLAGAPGSIDTLWRTTAENRSYLNTSLPIGNDQVTVITHMPRAALADFRTGSAL
jgi:hypothetical protein